MLEYPPLFPYACQYADSFISTKRKLNFHDCAVILNGATPEMVPKILSRLNQYDWLLAKCFSMACFSTTNNEPPLKLEWRENVKKLGATKKFDTHTMTLLQTF